MALSDVTSNTINKTVSFTPSHTHNIIITLIMYIQTADKLTINVFI